VVEFRFEFRGLDEMINALHSFDAGITPLITETLDEAGNIGVISAQALARVRTGYMRANIFSYTETPTSLRFISAADYSAVIEFGSRPHVIRAVRAKYLRFEKDGEVFYRKSVWHPGTRSYPFMMPAKDRILRLIPPLFIEKVRALLRVVGFS